LSDQGALSYRKTRVDPVQILQADLETFASEFKRKQFSINLEDDLVEAITIYADPDRLSQLYRNLITNSVKYTDQGGQLNISFRRDDALFVIEFSDSAPGVPEQELPKLFDRFYRLENSRNRNYGGAGLGLAICNNIVAAHNGSIQAQQSAFKGLKIKIKLPIG
jgi:two-component system sensor histidine kinase BaeS